MDINKAKSILIIPVQSDDLTYWQAAHALALSIQNRSKKVQFFANTTVRKYVNSFIQDESLIFDAESARDVIIKVNNFKDKANNLSWKQVGNTLELKIRTEHGSLTNPIVEVEQFGMNFDIKIFVGMSRQKAEKDKEIKKAKLSSGVAIFLEPQTEHESPTSLVFNFLKNTKFPINNEVSSLLVKSLYLFTDNFNKHTNSQTFLLASELVQMGGQIDNSLKNNVKTLDEKPPEEQLTPLSEVLETIEEESPFGNVNTEVPDDQVSISEPSLGDLDEAVIPKEHVVKNEPDPVKTNESVVPEELPIDFDPLAPAKEFPKPINTQQPSSHTQPSGPLPTAAN